MNVITTDTLLLMTDPTFPGDQLPHRKPPRDHRPLVQYCASANTIYSPDFSLCVSALHSLQEPKSYSEVVKSPNDIMQ